MKAHPSIALADGKEADSFSQKQQCGNDWQLYKSTYFQTASCTKLWGEVTPQYLSNPEVPDRISQSVLVAKLFVLLRNPIDRAYSAYRMMSRQSITNNDFHIIVRDLLNNLSWIIMRLNQPNQMIQNIYCTEACMGK